MGRARVCFRAVKFGSRSLECIVIDQFPARSSVTSPRPRLRRLRRIAAGLTALTVGVGAPVALSGTAHAETVQGAAQVQSHSATYLSRGYVALGDSYAAGEGLPPYEAGSDTATDQCHRSLHYSYPRLLQASPLPQFDRLTDVACSGAMTGALVASLPDESDEPPQLDALTPTTKTVTLTIGGNDAGFSKVLGACIYSVPALPQVPGQSGCRDRLDPAVSAAIAYLGGQGNPASFPGSVPIAQILTAIHTRSPHAKIEVTGYPRLFGTTFDADSRCLVGSLPGIGLYVEGADAQWIASKADQLNATIAGAVRQANQNGISARFVPVARLFAGHEVCDTGRPWVNSVVFTAPTSPAGPPGLAPGSFHPNVAGQLAYAAAVAYATQRSRSMATATP